VADEREQKLKDAEKAEKEAVAKRKKDEPDEQIGHLSPIEKAREKVLLEQGKLVQETLLEEQENRSEDDPLEVAKRERTEAEVRMAGEAERHAAAVAASDKRAEEARNEA
jgi:hypothetical protein